MNNMSSIIEGIMTCKWISTNAEHEENIFCKINIWREIDLFPQYMGKDLLQASPDDTLTYFIDKNELLTYHTENIIDLPISSYKHIRTNFQIPKIGRFYPLGLFNGLSGVFSSNTAPARIINIDTEQNSITIDTNHPLASYDILLQIKCSQIRQKKGDVGGECKDWLNMVFDGGPGMQVPYKDLKTDFELHNKDSFYREDDSDDELFYSLPRLTSHIDERCHINLINTYKELLKPNTKVLDLMSSYKSHLPIDTSLQVIGLGMNIDELMANPILSDFYIQDINKNPQLPFKDNSFDYVFCDLSVEYLIRPLEVFKEVSRVLSKDGTVCISFSNRYFPQKVIKLWQNIHEFERMGYVIEILSEVGSFNGFKTYSFRNFPRPVDDKYFGRTFISDPLYIVTAKRV